MKIIVFLAILSIAFARDLSANYKKVTYTVWVGDDVSQSYTINVRVEKGSKFITVMEEAASLKPSLFNFTFQSFDIGRFITSIGNASQDPENNKYWMLYELKSKPNANKKPSDDSLTQYGVDSLEVKNNFNYLFWLRTVNFHE